LSAFPFPRTTGIAGLPPVLPAEGILLFMPMLSKTDRAEAASVGPFSRIPELQQLSL
jgi:hypothetical protein